jgi:hypothetical protein
MIPPQAGPAPAVSLPLARILGDSRSGVGKADEPSRLHMPHVVCHGCGCFLLGRGLGLGVLLGQLTRMHDDKAQGLLGDAPIAVFNLHLAEHALAMPAPGRLILSPPRFLHQQGQSGLLPPPGFECLTDGTGPWD